MTAEVGYFSRKSLLRRVHRECAVGVLYGQRALSIGAAHPLNYVVTAIHARDRQRPFQELAWRAALIETIIFGSREEADSALAYVNKIHERVKGALPVDAGHYPAGSPYSALDPELLLWTIAVMADSAQYFFELFVGTLSVREKEAFWQDYLRLGELLKLPRASAPATHEQFRDWWHERSSSDDLYLTAEARQTGYAMAFQIPMPAYASPLKRAHNAVMLGSLPSQVRDLYGLHYTVGDEARFRKVTNAIRVQCKRLPRSLAHGSSSCFYRRIASEELPRIEHGRPTPYLASPSEDGTIASPSSSTSSNRIGSPQPTRSPQDLVTGATTRRHDDQQSAGTATRDGSHRFSALLVPSTHSNMRPNRVTFDKAAMLANRNHSNLLSHILAYIKPRYAPESLRGASCPTTRWRSHDGIGSPATRQCSAPARRSGHAPVQYAPFQPSGGDPARFGPSARRTE
jgi:uncharacterized protein (DUF2236 family)